MLLVKTLAFFATFLSIFLGLLWLMKWLSNTDQKSNNYTEILHKYTHTQKYSTDHLMFISLSIWGNLQILNTHIDVYASIHKHTSIHTQS